MDRGQRWLVSLSVLVLAAAPFGLGSGASNEASAAIINPITFDVPRIVDPIHTYGEPDIKVAPNGDIHVSGPAGTGTQHSFWNISKDDGDSFRVVQGLNRNNLPGPIVDKSSLGPGGGDTEIAISRNNKVFYSDLWALTCFTAATTSDSGKTIDSNPVGCSHLGADRQWMSIFDPVDRSASSSAYTGPVPLNYQAYTREPNGDVQVDKTTNGILYTSAGGYGTSGDFRNADGNIVVDQSTGKVLAITTHNPTDPNKFGLGLAIGTPDAAGNLTYTQQVITDDLQGSEHVLFPVLAEDTARNMYAVWPQDANTTFDSNFNASADCPGTKEFCFHIYYSWASAEDGWTKWSAPKQLDQSPSLTSIFPWVAAGGPGIIDVVWYGSDQRLDPSSHNGQNWDAYMSQIVGANTAAPTLTQGRVSPHPMHHDDICLQGTACIFFSGDRNLADFFQVAIDAEGRARVVYDDTSNELKQENFPDDLDHAGAPIVNVARQSTGVNAWTGMPLQPLGSNLPMSGVTDPKGDALVNKPLGGVNEDGVDIEAVGLDVEGDNLVVSITTFGDSLSTAAQRSSFGFAQLVARWQLGTTLHYAGVEASATGAGLTYYGGKTKSIDLCSVSACAPHVLLYPAPPAGGISAQGSTSPGNSLVYKIKVPLAAMGMDANSLLEQVMAFATLSAKSVSLPITNAEADADSLPLEVEATKTFNFKLSALGTRTEPAPRPLASTGTTQWGVWIGGVLLLIGACLFRLVRTPITSGTMLK